ncbi:MAG: PEP-utilizing enzyme, partial [Euryarchaeota archaeon]|nr:PEP-utilizing enzyme [Euryarchaeota archaeon]
IVSRELGIPCIVGTGTGSRVLKTGQEVTIDTSEGQGLVYAGLLKFRVDKTNLASLPTTKTKIMMNVGVPEHVFTQGQIPCDGVGLARLEFIIMSHIGIHPLALIEFKKLKKKAETDPDIAKTVNKIEELTHGYDNKEDFFVEKLAWGVGKIAATFYPRDVIVRLSDFKTNEYASLLGGTLYEPTEENPMIGWRGASRYYAGHFREAFKLECVALRRVRDKKGLTNVKVMVPFCRTPEEGMKVIHTMAEFGLKQGENGLEVFMMAEIPSNVVLAEEFAEVFDGFSIGSNDLTQLMLGLDRDSELVSHLYNERSPAVKRMIASVIERVKKKGKKIGICGQAPSDFPDFAEFLVECGIDSISLNSDSVIKTRLLVAEKEKALGR